MDFKELVGRKSDASLEQFWKAMHIWLNNPHLVNRRISSCVNLLTIEIQCDAFSVIEHFWSNESVSKIKESILQGDQARAALRILDKYNPIVCKLEDVETSSKGVYLLVNKFLPRDSEKFSSGLEFTIVDKNLNSVSSFHRNENEEMRWLGLKHLYRISYENNRFSISVTTANADENDPSIRWLGERLFPRLLKWTESDRSKDDALVEGSLNLVSPEMYASLYGELKRKYGLEMVKKWPECTDPNKFVYEDVAIAAYLILLWEKERENFENGKKQTFLDLGCGNGLLVHILASEGYSGMGIDLRKRQIWDIYPSTTRLEERTIVPSSSSLFPDVDWLIGNHSDELTPWIPVIAARSSYSCRFFLLPCCAHEFDGRKFQRDSAAKSQYFEYIKYVKSVSEGCGFKTELDKLRIPSTKRICLIGTTRSYPEDETQSQDEIIRRIINARSSKSDDPEHSETSIDQWSRGFKPREIVERVRNCTRIDRTIIDEIINIVASNLLRKVRRVSIDRQPERTWNAGGQVELSEIAKFVPSETLKQLRNECGGLQTLLRNNGHIFQVVEGTVQFRVPGVAATATKKKRKGKSNVQLKVKPCWFHANHPDGCPASDELCNFKH